MAKTLLFIRKTKSMVKQIVELFYKLSKEHILINSFKYDLPSKTLGVGEDNYPLCLLEQPILLDASNLNASYVRVNLDFQILFAKQNLDNFDIPKPSVMDSQSLAYQIALTYIAKIKAISKAIDSDEYINMEVLDYSIVTLTNHTDDDCDGVRCTLNLNMRNPINFCDLSMFDENKEFEVTEYLPKIDTDDAEGCNGKFVYKFPKFNLD